MTRVSRSLVALAATLTLTTAGATELAELSLEELMKVEVTSVAKKAQALGNVAAAVHVITEEDIRASGARSLPEALRLAPGVDVAQVSATRWAVSIRGNAGRFSNKLQVMIDGRSVYSVLFSGVFWEAERLPLTEVDRIEVLRGPAGSTWGANAVNGVINIITKAAVAGAGTRTVLRAGTQGMAAAEAATSLAWGRDGALRVYTRAERTGALRSPEGGSAEDQGHSVVLGLRGDRRDDQGARTQFRVEALSGASGERYFAASVLPPYGSHVPGVQKHQRLVAQAQHERPLSAQGTLALSAAATVEDANLGSALRHRHDMLELDAQHRWQGLAGHDFTWGGGARFNHSVGTQATNLSFRPPRKDWTEWRLYGQDEWLLLPERLRATLGLRMDHNPFTGTQTQPSARLLWHLGPSTSLWAAASRAVRVPSRGESDILINLLALPPGTPVNPAPLPVLLRIDAEQEAVVAEKLRAFELGLRSQLDRTLSLDLALFDHRYSPFTSRRPGAPQMAFDPAPHLVVDLLSAPTRSRGRGAELALDWRPTARWRQHLSYALLDSDELSTPRHHLTLRSVLDVQEWLRAHALLRHVSGRTIVDPLNSAATVAAGTALDLSLAWRLSASTELSLSGTDLLRSARVEFVPELGMAAPTVIPRRWSLRLQSQF